MYRPRKQDFLTTRLRTGAWAWAFQRVSGLALVVYLLLHIAVLSSATRGEDAFDRLLATLQTPTFVVLDLGLLAAVAFHGLNGLRIVLFDLGIGAERQKALFWAVLATAALIVAVGTLAAWPLIAE